MIKKWPVCQLARVTLQTVSPLSIGSGRGDGLQDVLVVRDALGLPALPGTAIAGVLRHLYLDASGNANEIFGDGGSESRASRLEVTWGKIHDSFDRPVDGVAMAPDKDQIISVLVQKPLPRRDGVRVNHRGTADDEGKFDRSYVPIGHRFTFDLALWGDEPGEEMKKLLTLLKSPRFRLGGKVRSGFGAFMVQRVYLRQFDLRKEVDLKAYSSVSACLSNTLPGFSVMTEKELNPADTHWEAINLSLSPEPGGFRFGSGEASLGEQSGKQADSLPLSERVVVWQENGQGCIARQRQIAIPATSIKGALVHRVAFHFNRFKTESRLPAEENQAVLALFGCVKGKGEGKAGRVWINDVLLPMDETNKRKIATHQHTCIDRFAGGVREGALFSEEIVHDRKFDLSLALFKGGDLDGDYRKALKLALDDLAEGRLALGAGSAKGHGYFSGKLKWPKYQEG